MDYVAIRKEGLLFYAHVHNRSPLDQHRHSLMLLAIFSGAACTLLEAFIRDHPILELLRTSMFLLQGSWFWQIGFVLYSPWRGPGWDQADHGNIMFTTMCFCWHYMSILLLVIFNYTIIYSCIKWKKCSAHREFGKLKFSRSSYAPLIATDHRER